MIAKPVTFLAGDPLALADCALPSTLMYRDLDMRALGDSATYLGNIVTGREVVLTQLAGAKVMAEPELQLKRGH